MGFARQGAFVLLTAGTATAALAASVASCSYGGYDGSFDSAGLEILAAQSEAGGPPVTKAVSASSAATTTLATADGVFEIDVPAHAFPSDVTITVTPLGDRTIDNGFIVPVFQVTTAPDLTASLPIQILFRGNSNNTGPSDALVPVTLESNATTVLGVVGGNTTGGGPSQATLWALTKKLGATYTLAYIHGVGTSGSTLQEPSATNCLLSCCSVNKNGGSGNAQLYATDLGCACAFSNPNLDCFARTCPDIAAAAQRCVDLRILPSGPLACSDVAGCSAPSSVCCYARGSGLFCSGPTGTTGPGNTPCTYVERCTDDSQCNGNGVCCAFDDESLCSTACPAARRVCRALDGGAGACDGGAACAKAGNCSIRICGPAPAGCQ